MSAKYIKCALPEVNKVDEQTVNEECLKEIGELNDRYQELANELDKLVVFMEGRPHDEELYFVDAVIEYIEQVEKASEDRHFKLKQITRKEMRINGTNHIYK